MYPIPTLTITKTVRNSMEIESFLLCSTKTPTHSIYALLLPNLEFLSIPRKLLLTSNTKKKRK